MSSTVWYLFVSGMVVENLLFARALGIEGIIEHTRTYRRIARFGLMNTAVTLLGGMMAWAMSHLLEHYAVWNTVKGALTLCCLCVSYLVVRACGLRIRQTEHGDRGILLSAAFNGAAFGTMLLTISTHLTLIQTLLYSLGCSAGLTGAMLLVHAGRERLEFSRVPRAFTGLPITLIYIGVLSLAIYGLIGHPLPT